MSDFPTAVIVSTKKTFVGKQATTLVASYIHTLKSRGGVQQTPIVGVTHHQSAINLGFTTQDSAITSSGTPHGLSSSTIQASGLPPMFDVSSNDPLYKFGDSDTPDIAAYEARRAAKPRVPPTVKIPSLLGDGSTVTM